MTSIPRRSAVKRMAGLAGAGAVLAVGGTAFLTRPATAADSKHRRNKANALRAQQKSVHTGETSLNGWEMQTSANSAGDIWTRPVPGTRAEVDVRIGTVEYVLVHLVQRFHYEIRELRAGDVTGWCAPERVQKRLPESNRASGTAVAILPGHYPPGVTGGFHPLELTVLRDILAELGGTVRWGGDDRTPDESLFYVAAAPKDALLAQVASRVKGWRKSPGTGPGTTVDTGAAGRRAKADALKALQVD